MIGGTHTCRCLVTENLNINEAEGHGVAANDIVDLLQRTRAANESSDVASQNAILNGTSRLPHTRGQGRARFHELMVVEPTNAVDEDDEERRNADAADRERELRRDECDAQPQKRDER